MRISYVQKKVDGQWKLVPRDECTEIHNFAPAVFGDYAPYVSEASGKVVDGRKARREDLKATGCRPYEKGEREAYFKNRESLMAKQDREIDRTVERVAQKLGYY